MTAVATLMMVSICGLVWGGFVMLLVKAVRHEGRKRVDGGG